METKTYSIKQVAASWGCSRQLVSKEIKAGRLEAFLLGKVQKRITSAALQKYYREHSLSKRPGDQVEFVIEDQPPVECKDVDAAEPENTRPSS